MSKTTLFLICPIARIFRNRYRVVFTDYLSLSVLSPVPGSPDDSGSPGVGTSHFTERPTFYLTVVRHVVRRVSRGLFGFSTFDRCLIVHVSCRFSGRSCRWEHSFWYLGLTRLRISVWSCVLPPYTHTTPPLYLPDRRRRCLRGPI